MKVREDRIYRLEGYLEKAMHELAYILNEVDGEYCHIEDPSTWMEADIPEF